MTDEWVNHFREVQAFISKREEARRRYDHYDEKLENMLKTRAEKALKGVNEQTKELEFYGRVFFI